MASVFGPLIALLALLGLAVLWCFFTFVPEHANKKQISVFNWTVLTVLLIICIPFCFYVDSFLPPSRKEYLKFFAISGCLGIEIIWLTIAFLLRNFWIFKPSQRHYY